MHKLTAHGVKALKFDGRPRKHSDGGGLQLHVTKTARTWRYAYRHLGREKTYTIGSADTISLAEARRRHQEARLLVASGVDPVADRTRLLSETESIALAREKRHTRTVGELLDEWLERKKTRIASGSRTESNLRQLRPGFRGIRVAELRAPHVIEEMQAITRRRSADMAHRVLGCLRSALDGVLDDGSGDGLIDTNPVNHPSVTRELACRERSTHFPHITHRDELARVLVLIERCRHGTEGNLQTRALMWLQARLFTRPAELRRIRWTDVDFENGCLWIRGEETKSSRDFLVPLATQCLALFRKLEANRLSDHVFYSPVDPGKPLSDGALRPAMERAGISRDTIVPHGFRHTASTMINGRKFIVDGRPTYFRPDVIEAQLSHSTGGNKVRATYNKAEYIEERIQMMQAWADWLDELIRGDREERAQERGPQYIRIPCDQMDERTLAMIGGQRIWTGREEKAQA